jgi:predicted alpha/beta-fold hydrolase
VPPIEALELPPFKPRFPWWGPDLQTLSVLLQSPGSDLSPHTSERVCFPMADRTGDILLGMLDRPEEPMANRPLVLLIHGLTGCEDSVYILSAARHLLDLGYTTLRINVRGAGPSRAYCGEHNHVGRTADFRRVLWQLPEDLMRDGVVAVGYSAGGAMLLKYLGEEGASSPLAAAATISAPIDLAVACRCMMRPRNRLYHRYILDLMKVEATGEGAVVSAAERAGIMEVRTVWDYDDVFIAPRYGFASAEDYYERCRPTRFMAGVRVPTLVMSALDDPWIPGALYREYDWASNGSLVPLLPESGGHVGFHETGSRQPFSDLAVTRFFDHA